MKPPVSNDVSQNASTKLSISSRRRQSQGILAKAPQGPRPLDLNNQKRSVSGSIAPSYGSIRGSSNALSQNATPDQFSANDISQFNFDSIDPTTTVPQPKPKESNPYQLGSFSEPNFDFDAFQDNIIAASPRIDSFPQSARDIEIPTVPTVPQFETTKFPRNPAIPIPTRKISGAGNLSRKTSAASTTSRLPSAKSDGTSNIITTTSMLRGRRQTQFPPNAFNNLPTTTKAPRKSVGPGTFVAPERTESDTKRRPPSIHERKSSMESAKSALSLGVLPREIINARENSKSPRAIKAKSTLIMSRPSSKDLLTPSKTPEGSHSASLNSQVTPSSRRSGTPGRTTTPGAHGRRSSVATGLGARTISPTDARRLKRMSMVPPAPPLPQNRISQAPPTPQPELTLLTSVLPTMQSPGLTHRKSMTPSSSRTTPDPNRKSYSSGQSLSSSTSYNSARSSANITARLTRDASTSRLPTPKPRVETGSTPDVEEIPPVPAIPKSYESPASELEQPYFSARSSSLQQTETPQSDSPNVTTAAEAFAKLNIPPEFFVSSVSSDMDQRPTNSRKSSEKSESSLMLPPLNLLPLATPTTEKIRLLQNAATPRPETPPESRHKLKTPSTPMTASKASFFLPKLNRVQSDIPSGIPRSSTSHYVLRYGDKTDAPSPHLPAFAFEADSVSLRSVSPFLSTSAPKDGNEFQNYLRGGNFNTELKRAEGQSRPNGPRAPSYSLSSKMDDKEVLAVPPVNGSTNTSTTSVNAMISKTTTIDPIIDDLALLSGDSSKYDGMPPPKLPASATWSNLSSKTSSPPPTKIGFFRSRRKASTSSSLTLSELEPQPSMDSSSTKIHSISGRPSIDASRSLMSQSNKSGPLIVSSNANKSRDQELDRDDLLAEEEMKKLASKRRDFESAARQLDALRARAKPVARSSPTTAMQQNNLNIYERGEVVDFPDVFFTGTKNAKKVIGDLSTSSNNFGYDDERGDYNIVNGDHLAYRYEVVDLLGKGSFGQVVRCVDHKTGLLVAIKIIRNKKRFHQQALVEVDILQKLKEWDPNKKYNVVNFDQSFYFRGHLCISTDLLNMNLYEFIKAHDFRGFSLKLIRRFTKQMLASLILLHGKKVIHCDLKPENILLAHPAQSEIKVIDFGSSCFENEKVYTYIQSRFYRSPEVILGMSYGMPIDMWSLGCILAELYTGYPIFPGENEQEQLACIMEIFGPPEKHLIEKSSRKKLFFDSMGKPRLTVSSKGRRRRPSTKDLRSALKCDDEAFLDFISKCLRWDPLRRMTPQEASRHEFITGLKAAPVSTRKHITSAISTPLKRGNTISIGSARPLPQPPSTTLKPTMSARLDSLAPSPNKPVTRRQSNVTGFQAAAQAKRASHAAVNSASNSSLSRITAGQRSASSRTDLATAAAAASLVK